MSWIYKHARAELWLQGSQPCQPTRVDNTGYLARAFQLIFCGIVSGTELGWLLERSVGRTMMSKIIIILLENTKSWT